MSATSQPFGLRAAYSPSGIVRPTAYTILTGYGTTIYTCSICHCEVEIKTNREPR